MGANCLFLSVLVICFFATTIALKCFQCGLYNDGVGSITPCLNDSHVVLKECSKEQTFCIKYVSDSSTVRDCVPTCSEKEVWRTKTYCCEKDGCNTSTITRGGFILTIFVTLLSLVMAH